MAINADDLRIEPWAAAGGRHVGAGANGIKVTHIPSGIEACVDIGQSQFANRDIAIKMIEAAIAHPRFQRNAP